MLLLNDTMNKMKTANRITNRKLNQAEEIICDL